MDKKENNTRQPARKKSSTSSTKRKSAGNSNVKRKTSSDGQKRKTNSTSSQRKAASTNKRGSTSHLSYQRQGQQKRKKKRRKMSKTERYIRITINWVVFFAIVILLLFLIGKGISAAYHVLTGSSKNQTTQGTSAGSNESDSTEEENSSSTTSNQSIEITISAVGDCTLGTDETFGYDGSFTQVYDNVQDPSYFLSNVKSIFEADDLTIANLEGPLTMAMDISGEEYSFKGIPEYAKILSTGSVDAVNLANDHTMDYGEEGYNDTIEYLAQTGVKSFGNDNNTVVEINGVKVGLFGINATGSDLESYENQVTSDIAELKENGAELIIASFHWGIEKENYPTEMQQTLGHYAVDAGADLVLGHNSHVLQGIESYNGKNIVYSLGNFCYGANANPTETDTMIYQQTFTVTGGVVEEDTVTNIIPCKVSSSDEGNNYQPAVAEDEEADAINAKITEYSEGIGTSDSDSSSEDTEAAEATSESTDTSEDSGTLDVTTDTSEDSSTSDTTSTSQTENSEETSEEATFE